MLPTFLFLISGVPFSNSNLGSLLRVGMSSFSSSYPSLRTYQKIVSKISRAFFFLSDIHLGVITNLKRFLFLFQSSFLRSLGSNSGNGPVPFPAFPLFAAFMSVELFFIDFSSVAPPSLFPGSRWKIVSFIFFRFQSF